MQLATRMPTHRRVAVPVLVAGMLVAALSVASSSEAAPGGDTVPPVGTMGGPTRLLTPAEEAQWLRGRELFDRDFTEAEGLGTPEMNADSCRACHQDPIMGGAGGLELNVSRFAFDNNGAGPFQDLPGGQGLSKLRPPSHDTRENYPVQADVFEQRQTPSALGDGLIDLIADSLILAGEDPTDANGDGIFGVARILTVDGNVEVGKFGWKAQIPQLADFVSDAMGGECGITTPDNNRGFALLSDADAVADPELSQSEFDDIAFFLGQIGPPVRGGSVAPEVAAGEVLFATYRCDRCHTPTMMAAGRPVNLYSDLLLHDVMPAAYRGMSEDGAPSGMFRTPPLWGIKDTAPYMHDGRAETLTDAILAHESEGTFSAVSFATATAGDQADLLAFLNDL